MVKFYVRIFLILIVLSTGFSLQANAQLKIEREYRIKAELVPQQAVTYIRDLFPDSRIRWFGEINAKGYFVEAKFRANRKKYSIKFDSTGVFKDVEKVIRFRKLSDEQQTRFENTLDSLFTRYKIVKIQAQWIGNAHDIRTFLQEGTIAPAIEKNFEFVLRGKNAEGTAYREILFDESGNIKRNVKLSEGNTNHLLF